MFIRNCPIPFHDLLEIVEFLTHLSPELLCMFDGCCVDMLSYDLHFVVKCDSQFNYSISYRCL